MAYNSWLYLFPFLIGCVVLYYIMPLSYRWGVLLIGSIIFYVLSAGYRFLYVIYSVIIIYFAALFIEKEQEAYAKRKKSLNKDERKQCRKKMERKNRILIMAAIIMNLVVLVLLKYGNFLGITINQLTAASGFSFTIPHSKWIAPLGISFYTLTAISYVADVSRGICHAEKNILKLLLYLSFFTTITEGPIERYGDLGVQTGIGHVFHFKEFCFGCQIISWGLFQKVVLADRLNRLVSEVFGHSDSYTGLPVVVGILAYTFQLYMDFSGCINIARGSAQLFGIHLKENFRRPFFADSVNEFWRRWHISLGAWLKDYVFYPVSLSRSTQTVRKWCRNKLPVYYADIIPGIYALSVVWLINGAWHGAEWKYIFYGIYYFLLMVAGMLVEPCVVWICKKCHINRSSKGIHLLRQLRTFLLVNIGMLIFRARDVSNAFSMLQSIAVPYHFKNNFITWLFKKGNLRKYDILLLTASVVFLLVYGHYKESGGQLRETIAGKGVLVRWAVYYAAILCIVIMGAYGPGFGVGDFIYAQF